MCSTLHRVHLLRFLELTNFNNNVPLWTVLAPFCVAWTLMFPPKTTFDICYLGILSIFHQVISSCWIPLSLDIPSTAPSSTGWVLPCTGSHQHLCLHSMMLHASSSFSKYREWTSVNVLLLSGSTIWHPLSSLYPYRDPNSTFIFTYC